MVQTWIKWKLVMRWKNQWNYLKFLKYIPSGNKLWIIAFGISLFNFGAIFFSTYFLFKVSLFNKNFLDSEFNGIILNLIGKMLLYASSNYSILWSLTFCIILIFSFVTGISSSKWQLHSIDKEWLLTNLKISPAKAKVYLYLESTVWYSKDFLLSYVPVLLALGLLTEIYWLQMVLVITLTFVLFIFTSLATSVFHNRYWTLQKHKHNFLFRVMFALSIRLTVGFLSFGCGKTLSSWMSDFPITSNDLDLVVYQNWINDGTNALMNLLSPVGIFLENPYLPHNLLAMLVSGNIKPLAILSISGTFLAFLLAAYFLSKYESDANKQKYYPFILVEKGLTVLTKPLGKHYSNVLFYHHIRTDYFFHRFPVLLGSLPFWLQLGLFSGLLSDISPKENIFFLILSFYLMFFVFFYVDSVYTNLQGVFSLDSEGKKILIHFMAKKNLWDVFKYKFRFFIILTFPLMLLGDVIFISFNQMDIRIGILTILMHAVAYLLFSLLVFLPSVVSPHFNFINIEQLDEYPDKKTLQDMVKFIILGCVIPCSMLPTALLITDMISFTSFIFFQWMGVSLMFLLTVMSIILWIRKKLIKISGIDSIYL
ncbi:hypothetical protein GJU40_14870 [Bacillus lacus]|uniref:Uncharacterized protein n=1 Tax=Metabacillus lacus TaxID=1983721 RepID=A0A7X2J0Y6_9BACI|nr:hypothetical protein [Metabacillus lacus]MRX73426.1 hypothetical protein [Metabacillus lacus]